MAVREKIVITADNKTARAFREVQNSAKLTSAGLASMSMKMAGVAAVGAAAAAGLFLLTKRAIESADAIAKVADKVGLGVESLQELRFGAEEAGVATNTLDMAMQRFSRRVGEAAKGQGELKDTLELYNIAVNDSEGNTRKLDDVLDDYANAIQNAGSQQEKLRLAFKGFDSEGAALVNMFKDGSAGLKEMREQAQQLGIVLDEDAVRGAEAANDALNRMERILSVNLQKILLEMAPQITAFGLAFANAAPQISRMADEVIKFFFGVESLSLSGLRNELEELTDAENARALAVKKRGATHIGAIKGDIALIGVYEKEKAKLLELIAAGEKREEQLRKMFETPAGIAANDNIVDKTIEAERKRAEALLMAISETNMQVLGLDERLLESRHEQELAKLFELFEAKTISTEEFRAATAESEATFEQSQHELRLAQMQVQFDEEDELRQAHMATLEGQVEQHLARINQNETFAAELNKQIWESGLKGKMQITGKLMGQLSVLMESNSRKMFEVGKAAAIGSTVIETITGAQRAFTAMAGIPYVGPILGALAAAAAIAAGMARVQQIKSQSFKGGGSVSAGGGGGGFGGGGAPSVPDVPQLAAPANDIAPSRELNVTIVGHAISAEQVRDELIPMLNEAAGDGVTINATVATG